MDGGLLYSTSGLVVDPKKMALAGTFPVGGYLLHPKYMTANSDVPTGGLMAPDSSTERVSFLNRPSLRAPFPIKIFDRRSFVLLARVDLDIEGVPVSFVQVGKDRYAFQTTAGKVYFVRVTSSPTQKG
jgi:hypothetical protein